MSNTVLMSAICPHPPIIIPEVGRSETGKVEKTVLAVQNLSNRIVEANPDTVIVITPHSYFNAQFFNVYIDKTLEGDFSNFGAPTATVSFENDTGFIENLDSQAKEFFNGLNKIPSGTSLDHGSTVPLYYLAKAGYKGKIAVINYTAFGAEEHVFFGEIIRKTAAMLERKIAFIASSDLSHKLSKTAPAGYHPDAHFFDEDIENGITEGNYTSLMNISPILRKKAGECGFNSIMVGIGVVDKQPLHNEVLSYEAPFGVGYLVATL
jgi:AmmeMemoRadiSam system protein B